MSGIVGYIKHQKTSKEDTDSFALMYNAIKKRGQYEKLFIADYALLGGRSNKQSATNIDSPLVIAYSGKLFNKKELQSMLNSHNIRQSGNLDEELILQAYTKWGKDGIAKLNGYFALAIWDKEQKKLFAARDRMGVEPFFYYRYGNGLIFGSEIKALMASGLIKGEIDSYGLKQLLLLGPSKVPSSGIIVGVQELKCGEYLEYDCVNQKVACYWKPTAHIHTDDYLTTVDKTRELIIDAITRQIDGDDLACFLSGGLDSSIITKVVADIYHKEGKRVKTFSVDYKGNDIYFEKNSFQSSPDNSFIDIMSRDTNSDHKYIMLDNDELISALQQSHFARDLPGMGDIDTSLMLLCQKVGKETNICMSGECADEFFGGYPWYHREELLYRDNFPWLNALPLRESLFNSDVLGKDNEEFVYEEYKSITNAADCLDGDDKINKRIREMFMLNYYYFMQTLLDRSDRMSAGNLEIRVPFCDNAIIDYAYNMPWEFKSANGREKGIMRDAFADMLPKAITQRKKTPYPKTFNPIFKKKLISCAERLVNDKESILSQIVNKDTFNDLCLEKISVANPWYGQLMRLPQIFGYLIELDMFFRRFNLQIKQ